LARATLDLLSDAHPASQLRLSRDTLIQLERDRQAVRDAVAQGVACAIPDERLRAILPVLGDTVDLAQRILRDRTGANELRSEARRVCADLAREARRLDDEALILSGRSAGASKSISPRDRYCWNRYHAGDLLKEIQAQVAARGWDLLDTPQAVRAVVVRTAERLGEPIPRRRRV
jgi:hypothetical protein